MITKIPKILLPKLDIDYSKWAVVACDQFTSQPKYWENLKDYVGDSPSTLSLIYPEIYLEEANKKERIANINNTMRKYINDGLFDEFESLIMVDRVQNDGKHRVGLILSIDLEAYEYTQVNNALIKATEKTIVDRLPPRIEIRKDACLETPHIMMLMDDTDDTILSELYAQKDSFEIAYHTQLNMNGGEITAYFVPDGDKILRKIEELASPEITKSKYGNVSPILFAVGDGNHSLATAKECWNDIKNTLNETQRKTHPARFALCELMNLHSSALEFQPIHRVIKNADKHFIEFVKREVGGDTTTKMIYQGEEFMVNISSSASDAIADLQKAIDDYCRENKHIVIDYIHGDDYLLEVAQECDGVAVFMPNLAKQSLFDYCARRGVLPRKSFSMGHAEDKRYYLECKLI